MLVTNPFNAEYDLDRASRSWWVLLLSGIFTAVAGGIILFTDWKLADLAVFVGALFVFHGLFQMLSVPIDGSSRAWTFVLGLLEVGLGVMVWAWPSPTLLVIAFFIGWWVLFGGAFTIAGAIAGRDVLPYWGFMLAVGILQTVIGGWLLTNPGLTLVAGVLAIGIWALLVGVTEIGISFDVKRLRDRASTMDRGLHEMSRSYEHVSH